MQQLRIDKRKQHTEEESQKADKKQTNLEPSQ